MNPGIDRLETVILEALSLVSRSRMYGDVALDSKMILRSVNLSTQLCGMKNSCGNTLEIRSGASSIALEVNILFGSSYAIFVSRVIKWNCKNTRY